MWEGDPVGVDQKRPLVGFALVSVLCAVLMALSVGRGWSVDLFHPGKPIAAPDTLVRVDGGAPTRPDEPGVVVIPDELEPQPLAVAALSAADKGTRLGRSGGRDRDRPETAAEDQEPAVEESTEVTLTEADGTAGTRAAQQAEKAAARLERLAQKAAEQAAEKATEKAAAKAAEKAERLAEAAAEAAAQAAEEAAALAQGHAEQTAAQAAHLTDQLLRQAARIAG